MSQQQQQKQPKTIGQLTNEKGGMSMFQNSDLLYLNQFIQEPERFDDEAKKLAFKRLHEAKLEKERREAQVAQAKQRSIPTAPLATKIVPQSALPPLISDGPGTSSQQQQQQVLKYKKRKTTVCVSSARRDTTLYPDIADFKIYIGQSFANVYQVRVTSLVFPNVDQPINDTCNKFYWINEEDIDIGYPIYMAAVARGSYTISTMNTELSATLNTPNIKRRGNLQSNQTNVVPPHYFIIDTNADKDIVSFTSVKTTSIERDPIQTFASSNVIRFNMLNHGLKDREKVYVIGVRGIIGGIQSAFLNAAHEIRVNSADFFTFEISQTATESANGGGTMVKLGKEAPWQLLGGRYIGTTRAPTSDAFIDLDLVGNDIIIDRLGFRSENASVDVSFIDPLTCLVLPVIDVIPGVNTRIVSPNHKLRVGDIVTLYDFLSAPSIYNDKNKGDFVISAVPTPDTFEIPFTTQRIYHPTRASIGTRLMTMTFPNHGFNRITKIEQAGPDYVEVTTLFDHNIDPLKGVFLNKTNSVPSVDGFYTDIVITANPDVFQLHMDPPVTITTPGFEGILTTDHSFYLYGVQAFGGYTLGDLNNQRFEVREILDADTFTFVVKSGFAKRTETGGGGAIRINSKLHGWSGTHSNLVGESIFKPINLAGRNIAYLCSPTLGQNLLVNSDKVKSALCQAFLTAPPMYTIFNQFLAEPFTFNPPLATLGEMHFQFKDQTDQLMVFNGLNYDVSLEITELVPFSEEDEKMVIVD